MNRDFKDRYFRYVDDVALVVERSEVETAKKVFGECVASEGLRLNEDKTDVGPGIVWQNHHTGRTDTDQSDKFSYLIGGLCQYLAHNPEEFDEVRSMFRNEGFSLPFSRVRSISNYRPYRRFARRVIRSLGYLGLIEVVNPKELLITAVSLRYHIEARVTKLTETSLPLEGIQRRWAIQEYRFLFNQLLYLLPMDRLSEYAALIPNAQELAATRAVYDALIKREASELTQYPGPSVSAFCQLWIEGQANKPSFTWSLAPKSYERDAVITLSLYGLCDPPTDWVDAFKSDPSHSALKIAARNFPDTRPQGDFSYIDEIESLFLRVCPICMVKPPLGMRTRRRSPTAQAG